MKLIHRTLLIRIVVVTLFLYIWRRFVSETSQPHLSELSPRQQLDIAITGHTNQITKFMVPRNLVVLGLADKIRADQTHLSCYIHHGTWETTPSNQNHSLHYHSDPGCLEGWSSLADLNIPQLTEHFCSRAYGRQILLVGPRPFFHVQTLLLEALLNTGKMSYRHRNPEESGSHHSLCRNVGMDDKAEHLNLPFSPHNKSHLQENSSTSSTRLSFSLSDTLLSPGVRRDKVFTSSFVDLPTGVRQYNSDWFTDLRKSHVLLINKGPSPAPAWTYDGHTGNWSLHQDMPQYLQSGSNDSALTSLVVNAAFHVVFQVYLPELIQALSAIPSSMRQQKIFIGSWYQQPICTNAGLSASFQTTSLIWAKNTGQVDPWSLYYNTQVYIINQALPAILPYYNITYVPMTIPLIPDLYGSHNPTSLGKRKDCLRPASSEPVGHTLQLMLMRSLVYLLK